MGWVRINDKMPDNGERVLLFTPYDCFGEDHLCIGDNQSIRICKTKMAGRSVPIFTHWMPLPGTPDGCRP